ncbi:unnamed protein product [Cylindrotheca closterium]|uniref:Uncharacterized protein n=1 Tax=Cylindrotheca closterium TaxID=2856 RepID=A0AAD2CBH8_9STRA|nr:unnamed protein product [Cylindrotheca closterium]
MPNPGKTRTAMSDDLDFTAMDENGMSYEDIIAAVEHENNKQGGKEGQSTGYNGGKMDGKSEVSQGMDASSFDDQNGRGDTTEFYENSPDGATLQPEAMQEDTIGFASSTNNSAGGKENSSRGVNTSNSCHPNGGNGRKTNANASANDAKEAASPADDISREAGIILENKIQEVQEWCKKLLEEITVYVQVANKTNEEFLRIQKLEHQESERLDRVEPDVKGATSQLLGYPFYGGTAQNQSDAATLEANHRVG